MSITKYLVVDDVNLKSKMRRNTLSLTSQIVSTYEIPRVETLAVVTLIELLHPIKFIIFTTDTELYALSSSDMLLLKKYFQ